MTMHDDGRVTNVVLSLLGRAKRLALLAVTASVFVPAVGLAQSPCSEGVAANGQCVNADLAAAARQTAFIMSQRKISETAYPVLPVQDFKYRYPHNVLNFPAVPAPTGIPLPPPPPPSP